MMSVMKNSRVAGIITVIHLMNYTTLPGINHVVKKAALT